MEDTHVKSVPPQPRVVRVPTAEDVLEFTGIQVADSSSDSDNNQRRWTDLVLYRLVDGSGRYVLQVIGRSIVYHAVGGCNRGVETSLADLADRYLDEACVEPIPEPCETCRPLDIEADLDDVPAADLAVKMETDRYAGHECQDVAALLRRLRSGNDKYSLPALLLLDRAKRVDPAIATALSQPRRL